jgi:hypothetical protein
MPEYDTMTEVERRELHLMLSGLSGLRTVSPDTERGRPYYEYDDNRQQTVQVTPDGQRKPVSIATLELIRANSVGYDTKAVVSPQAMKLRLKRTKAAGIPAERSRTNVRRSRSSE